MHEAKVCSTSSVWMATSVQTELGAGCLDDAWIWSYLSPPLPQSSLLHLLFRQMNKTMPW